MKENISDVCVQLDKLYIQILELTQEQVKNRVKMEEQMKSGFINIAKTRYIMGNKSVSSLQLPTKDSPEFNALFKVQREEEEDKVIFKLCEESDTENACSKNSTKDVRKRQVIAEKEDTKEEDDTSDTKKDIKKTVVSKPNPIKWFGVLVPQNLQSAQSTFQSLLGLVVESSNIQCELDSTLKKYKDLLDKKSVCTDNDVSKQS